MANKKHLALVSMLRDQTRKGLLDWKEHPQDGAFQLSFPQHSLVVSAARGEFDMPDYYIRVLNDEGTVVDSFSDVELWQSMSDAEKAASSVAGDMQEIYESARRTALGAEKAVDEILEYLKNNDLPF